MPRPFSTEDFTASQFLNNVRLAGALTQLARRHMFSTNRFVDAFAQDIIIPSVSQLTEGEFPAGGAAIFIAETAFAHTITPSAGVTINGGISPVIFSTTPYNTVVTLIRADGDNWLAFKTAANVGDGSVDSVVAGDGISVDASDSANPIVSNDGVITIVAGSNITVDNTDPQNPVVSASGGGGSFSGALVSRTATINGSISFNAAAPTTFPWDTENYDVGGWFNIASPTIFTVPSGVSRVRLVANLSFNIVNPGASYIRFAKNGTPLGAGGGSVETVGNADVPFTKYNVSTAVIEVIPGDTFALQVFAISGGVATLQVGAVPAGFSTWMSIEKVS